MNQLNWDAIGAVAEIAAAVLVVVSLLYLTREVRLNTRAVTSERFHAHMNTWHSLSSIVIQDPGVADLLLKSKGEPGALDENEKLRLDWLLTKIFGIWEAVHMDGHLGLVGGLEAWDSYFLDLATAPAFRDFWEANKEWYQPEFVERVDPMLRALSGAADARPASPESR